MFNSPCNIFKIATYNVRSLNEDWKKCELVSKAMQYNLFVVAIQEHRILKKNEINMYGYKFCLAPPLEKF